MYAIEQRLAGVRGNQTVSTQRSATQGNAKPLIGAGGDT